jgi:arsenite methyltransferase
MAHSHSRPQRPNYGIDAPKLVLLFLLIGVAGVGLAPALAHCPFVWLRYLTGPAACAGAVFLPQAVVMFWGSKAGKLHLRDRLITSIPWRGDEKVLDVGCGHGLMLMGAAKQLRSGRAIGLDLWQKEDQAGNSAEATLRNAALENVANRVELRDGDARQMPFPDDEFDVVLSSWALHNIYDRAGRDAAVREIARVLKPGGRLVIVDIRHVREYAEVLRQTRVSEIQISWPNFLFVIPTLTLKANKAKSQNP